MSTLAANKKRLRREALARRDSIPAPDRERKSLSITNRLLELSEVQAAHVVMVYAAMRSEADTVDLVQWAWQQGKEVGFPVTVPEAKQLLVVPVTSFDQLRTSNFGVPEPDPWAKKLDPGEIDVVIVPGAAFDPRGFRIGYGAGYYDRFLPQIEGISIGIGFAEQVLPMVPADAHDVPVDLLVTDEQVIYCRRQADQG